ncbi:4a-hydroxytetrahydrobiopterin dehydratase [Streptomyces sp. NPDC012794]|uniref:4a-hydroxytetrahydrobiopterin dehydratase n=1 Tax=Streptomyces sp. NPDC012794 TaxID=3364850 RepID=UPI0036A823CF
MGVPMVLTDEQITEKLAGLPGWERKGDEITRTYAIRYHAAVAAIVTIADRSRRIQHHADLDLRIDHLRATITTHDAGYRLTAADFDLAHRIDAIVAAHQSLPLD